VAVSPPKAPPRATTVRSVPPEPKPPPEPLPDGFAASRERVRRRGWLAGLLLPVIVIALAAIVLVIPANGHIANILGITGSLLALCAVPTAVAFGIPVEVGPIRALLAVVTSLLMWALLGWWSGRRVSRRVVCGWKEWAVDFGWIAVCLWAGLLTGVGVLLHLAS
jgi:hypothetical protein